MLKSAIIYFAGRVEAALIVFLSIAIYTRLLSPAEYGMHALSVSGVIVACAASMQWMASSFGRFLPAHPDRQDRILSHVAASYLVVALIVFVCVLCSLCRVLELDADGFELLALGVVPGVLAVQAAAAADRGVWRRRARLSTKNG